VTKDRWEKVPQVYDAAHDKHPEERLPFVRAGCRRFRPPPAGRIAAGAARQTSRARHPNLIAVGVVVNDNPPVQPEIFVGPFRIDTSNK
jgi:hypothetical protein